MSLVRSLEDLVRFPTVTGNHDAARACYEYIKNELSGARLLVREYSWNGFPSLVFTTRRTKRPKLWLVAHIDVVCAEADQFVPEQKNGKLYGRGVLDMKFAIACYIELIKSMSGRIRDYDLGIMLTSDEETGGFDGVRQLLNKKGYSGDVAFLPDGGGPWALEERAKGKWQVRIHARGEAAHGSRPWVGRNANHTLIRFLHELEQAVQPFELSAREHDHWHLTLQTTLLAGGDCENRSAASATATLDIRPTSGADIRDLTKIFRNLQEAHGDVRVETVHCEPPYGLARSDPYATSFRRIAKKQADISCTWTRSHGSSDGRYFSHAGIPALLVMPAGDGAHGKDEWIDVQDLERYYAVLCTWVDEVAKSTPIMKKASK